MKDRNFSAAIILFWAFLSFFLILAGLAYFYMSTMS